MTMTVNTGGEQRSDGLLKHYGIIDAGQVRATDNQGSTMKTGQGTEMLFDRPSKIGYLLVFDRESGTYLDLYLSGKNINLQAQGGKVILPAGTTQALIGSYNQQPTYVAAAAGWLETDVRANFTSNGGLLRFEFSGALTSTAAGQQDMYLAFGIDGGNYSPQMVRALVAQNAVVPAAVVYYGTPSAGAHRASIMMYSGAGGGFAAGCSAALYVTEQRA